jgi:hypothetical protein
MSEVDRQPKQERGRLDAAIQALEGTEGHGKRRGALGNQEQLRSAEKSHDVAEPRKQGGFKVCASRPFRSVLLRDGSGSCLRP